MKSIPRLLSLLPVFGLMFIAVDAQAQSFRVQCPTSTPFHPDGSNIKCQQVAGGDGYATMADGSTIYMFGFGPLSGLPDIYKGLPGTELNSVFNTTFGPDTGTPSTLVGMPDGNFAFSTAFNGGPFMGAIGLTDDLGLDPWIGGTPYTVGTTVRTASGVYMASTAGTSGATAPTGTTNAVIDGSVTWAYQGSLLTGHVDPRPIMDVGIMNASQPAPLIAIDEDDELFLTLTNVGMIMRPDLFEQHTVHFHGYPNASAFYDGVPDASIAINVGGSFTYYYLAPDAGTYFWHCHIAPPEHLQMGMVGQIYVRPRQNKVTGNLQAALLKWETAATPAAITNQTSVTAADWSDFEPLRKRCGGTVTTAAGALVPVDVLCTTPVPPSNAATRTTDINNNPYTTTGGFAYNDGDGSTHYDVEYPIQIHGFDPNFHFVGMTFNPESFNDMKDKYFMLNGRSYPDTVGGHNCAPGGDPLPACQAATAANNVGGVNVVAGPMETQSVDGTPHASQPIPTVINIPAGGHALLRISDLDVFEYQTLASLGIPMRVVGLNARLLRDMAGNNMAYNTNSITLAGGESIDVILDATGLTKGQKFFLYTPNLDHLSNDAENFGGLMTEVNICSSVDPQTKACTI
ncbi:MAG: multicopper oxidase domain-containing protein [Gammaproteobacteria bacterium]